MYYKLFIKDRWQKKGSGGSSTPLLTEKPVKEICDWSRTTDVFTILILFSRPSRKAPQFLNLALAVLL